MNKVEPIFDFLPQLSFIQQYQTYALQRKSAVQEQVFFLLGADHAWT